jgi:hypothetical protein
MPNNGLAAPAKRGTRIAIYTGQVKAMWNSGWSWSLRVVLALAVAAAMWVGAATLLLGALQVRARAGAMPVSALQASNR